VSPAGEGSVPDDVLMLALQRPPTLGSGRLICVDGPAGAGKSTLAAALETEFNRSGRGAAAVVHMDDLYEGWSGLPTIHAQLGDLLLPLSRDEPGSYRRYDWHTARFAETVTVAPSSVLVLEGGGSGANRFAGLVTVLVWVEAPYELRMVRSLERDGDAFAPHWEQWARDEEHLFAHERTRERADVLVDGRVPLG
jgi:uridine kinase